MPGISAGCAPNDRLTSQVPMVIVLRSTCDIEDDVGHSRTVPGTNRQVDVTGVDGDGVAVKLWCKARRSPPKQSGESGKDVSGQH
jgi:hypothetical protein